jgi:hypothetical protein
MFDSVDEKKWGSDDSDLRRSAAESGATDLRPILRGRVVLLRFQIGWGGVTSRSQGARRSASIRRVGVTLLLPIRFP